MTKVHTESRLEFLLWFSSAMWRQLIIRCFVEDITPATSKVNIHLYTGLERALSAYQIVYEQIEPRIYATGITVRELGNSVAEVRRELGKKFDEWETYVPFWLDARPVIAYRKRLDGRVEEISPSGILLLQHYSGLLAEVFDDAEKTPGITITKLHLREIFHRLNAFLIRQNEEWKRITGMKW